VDLSKSSTIDSHLPVAAPNRHASEYFSSIFWLTRRLSEASILKLISSRAAPAVRLGDPQAALRDVPRSPSIGPVSNHKARRGFCIDRGLSVKNSTQFAALRFAIPDSISRFPLMTTFRIHRGLSIVRIRGATGMESAPVALTGALRIRLHWSTPVLTSFRKT
jgi:hypothetical protein